MAGGGLPACGCRHLAIVTELGQAGSTAQLTRGAETHTCCLSRYVLSYLLHSDNQLNHATKTKNVSILRAPRNHLYSNTVCLMVSFRRGSLSGVGPKGTGTQPTKRATFAQVLFRAQGDLRISGCGENSPPSLLLPKSATDVSLCAGVRCTPGRGRTLSLETESAPR